MVYDALPALDVDLGTRVQGSRAAVHLAVVEPTPAVRIDVVLAPVPGSPGASRLAQLSTSDRFVDQLTPSGWEEGGNGPTGLPPAGVLVSLSDLS
jgi:hypothetical protein